MTDVFLTINILVYCGQVATWGKLLAWGAQVNHLIDKGQWWRLATSNFLHENVTHLLLNCLGLNAIGPKVEAVAGPERFLLVYVTSGIASSAMSYRFNKASSVGASGAFFGLVGYLAVHFLRHRGLTGDADKGLDYIGQILLYNMILGLMIKRIDYWAHVGGFLGGAAASWLLDPTGKLEYRSGDGRKAIDDIKGTEDPGAANESVHAI
ncbi:RHOMBOID-like protein 10, chloroplastic [Rhodamnia argentea]|uniref:RHOMBOID-like protein 10, chloroplastic n=1 Tax=Rhodamnia argentea TaxID=178133 RepID=A0ABM3H4V5_9MYRT|nr:RHOMBOID-like protein 10, chloroplastic [Rhodamnia argentea]